MSIIDNLKNSLGNETLGKVKPNNYSFKPIQDNAFITKKYIDNIHWVLELKGISVQQVGEFCNIIGNEIEKFHEIIKKQNGIIASLKTKNQELELMLEELKKEQSEKSSKKDIQEKETVKETPTKVESAPDDPLSWFV